MNNYHTQIDGMNNVMLSKIAEDNNLRNHPMPNYNGTPINQTNINPLKQNYQTDPKQIEISQQNIDDQLELSEDVSEDNIQDNHDLPSKTVMSPKNINKPKKISSKKNTSTIKNKIPSKKKTNPT